MRSTLITAAKLWCWKENKAVSSLEAGPHFADPLFYRRRGLPLYFTTIFTSLPGTNIFFTICLPAMAA
jgi:hypothetical protein